MSPNLNPIRHDYLVVDDDVYSFQSGDSMIWSQGFIDSDEYTDNAKCETISEDSDFDKAMLQAIKETGAPKYNVWSYPGTTPCLLGARNCQTWADDVIWRAQQIQKGKK